MSSLLDKLNGSFQKMEVPLSVVVGGDSGTGENEDEAVRGKFVQADQDIPADTILFIECPLVSWRFHNRDPTQSLRCDYCLKAMTELTPAAPAAAGQSGSSSKGKSGSTDETADNRTVKCAECPDCAAAFFCDERCMQLALNSGIHGPFCGEPERALREFTAKLEAKGADRYNFNVEALSRCIAIVSTKFIKYCEALFASEQGDDASLDVQTAFALATDATFDQFVAAPDTSGLDIDVSSWLEVLSKHCTAPLRKFLKRRVSRLLQEKCGMSKEDAKVTADDVSKTVSEALLSDETILTFLGQLLFNSTSINAPPKAAAKLKGGATKQTFCSVGAGLFSLQSCFNHSCDPNVTVQFSSGDSTIELKTIKPIKKGEEATISYLNSEVLSSESVQSRRQLLAPYLFDCACARCQIEEKTATAAAVAKAGKRNRDDEPDDDDDDEVM